MSNQLAVLFPGIGYHIDKPLLYYSAKLARARGYDLLAVQYPALPTGLRGHAEKIEQAVQTALSAAEEQLTAIDWTAYDRVFFLSKSIGTAIAARYAVQHNIHPRQVCTTRRSNRPCPISTRPASPFTAPPIRGRTPR